MEPQEVFDVMQAEAAALEAFLDGLPFARWDEPSRCQDWSIGDVIAHLTSGSSGYVARIRRALGEAPAFTPRTPGSARESIANEARRLRADAGPALGERFKRGNAELAAFLRGLTPERLHVKLRVAGLETEAWFYAALRTAELSIHGWDIRRPFDSGAALSEAAAAVLADIHLLLFVAHAVRPGESELRDGRFRFDLSGPPRTLALSLDGGAPSLAPAPASTTADAVFAMTASDFALLLYGRVAYDALLAEGRVSVEGDRGLADAFGRLCRGV